MAQVKDLEASLLDKKDKQLEEPEPVKSIFWTKLSLAASMAFWVTLFYVPLVVPDVKQWFFVDMDLPTVLQSPDFKDYWPNTVQLIVFTVYFSTGSTVNNAWQGLAGTVGAGLNQFMMGKLFPVGGKCITVGKNASGLRGFCEEFADPNYAKFEWFVWFDVIFFMFLILSSNAKENTVKFGLSWHVTYMMAFMSPTGFQPSHAVNITTVFGVFLAILITLVPSFTKDGIRFNQMVANNIEGHPVAIAKKCREISEGTVKFILAKKPETMEERYHYKVDKVAIVNKIEELEPMAGNMADDWATSWWEGWLQALRGGVHAITDFRKARTHCGIFAKAFQDDIGGFDDVAFVMKKVVSMMEVSDYTFMHPEDLQEVEAERASLRAYLEGLNESSMGLLKEITNWKDAQEADQNIQAFSDRIGAMKKDCDAKFAELYGAYTAWTKANPVHKKSESRQLMRTNMSVAVFAVLQMAKEVMDLSDKVIEKYVTTVAQSEREIIVTAVKDTWEEFVNTWWSSDHFQPAMLTAVQNPEKRSFVLRNVVSIGLCFLFGNILQGNVFTAPYNSLLAGTLAVLISHFPGSAFYKNLMRLLGLAIGNALPIIMLAPVSIAGPDISPYLHLLMFFLFELYFGLMYYTSPEWAYVGCIVAGFGCYSFTTPDWSNATFAGGYCKIGQVTAAIAVQIIVDIVDTTIRGKYPPDIVVENMKTMLWGGPDEKGQEHDGLVKVFEKFQHHLSSIEPNEELMTDIKGSVKSLKGVMASQEQLVSECEAKTTMIAGPSPAFRLDLYKGALSAVKELLGELDALCLVDEFSGKIGELVGNTKGEWFDQQYKNFYKEVLDAMKQTFETLMMIMTKGDEGMIPKSQVKVSDVDEDSTHHTDTVRMCVVKRIIGDTLKHVLEIEHLCCESGVLEFDI